MFVVAREVAVAVTRLTAASLIHKAGNDLGHEDLGKEKESAQEIHHKRAEDQNADDTYKHDARYDDEHGRNKSRFDQRGHAGTENLLIFMGVPIPHIEDDQARQIEKPQHGERGNAADDWNRTVKKLQDPYTPVAMLTGLR